MKRTLYLLSLIFLFSACASPMPDQMSPNPSQPAEVTLSPKPKANKNTAALKRGINFGNMLEAPSEGAWGLRVQAGYFERVKEAGFDFVRLPVRWSNHAKPEAPYTIDPAFLARVDEVIGWALERGLVIIVNLHHYEEMASGPQSHKERFLGLWRQIADHYKDHSSNVIFELFNEPNGKFDAVLWNKYLREALAVVRESNPARDVIVGPVNWNAYDWLSTLDMPDDEYLIVTFHYYLPFQFTHQGTEWVGDQSGQWLGTEWGSDAEKTEIVDHFDAVSDWSQRHGNVRILLGEFGAYSKADMESRVRWMTFVRAQAEAHGFAWAYWEFGSGFGAYDPVANTWRRDLLKALMP